MNGVVRKIEHDMQCAGLLATQRQVEEIKKWKEAQRDGHRPLLEWKDMNGCQKN